MPNDLIRQGLDFTAEQMGYPGMDMPQGRGRPEPSLANILALLEQMAMQKGGHEVMQGAEGMAQDALSFGDDALSEADALKQQFLQFLGSAGSNGAMIPQEPPSALTGAMTYTKPGMTPGRGRPPY